MERQIAQNLACGGMIGEEVAIKKYEAIHEVGAS